VAIDRPAKPPDRPEPPATPDKPPGDPDPYNVASLTRAQAYESQRAKAEAEDSAAPLADRANRPRDYWSEVPRFSAAKAQLADRWPGLGHEESSAPREHDVSAERRHQAVEKVRSIAEGEPPISEAVRTATAGSPHDGQLTGFEYRRKGADRLMEKALDGLEAQPDATAEEVVGRIPDAIRYTVCFETDDYVNGYLDIKNRLEVSGFEMYYAKNSWADPEYKGINTRWLTPEGQRFEVQFHTLESFHAKHEVTHLAYERLRRTQATRAERADLGAFQCEVSSWIPLPERVADISNYKKEGF
jgi:hypothetical protein